MERHKKMVPTIYHKKHAITLTDPLLRACFCGLLGVVIILGLFLRDPHTLGLIVTTVLVLGILLQIARILRMARPKHNMLRLDPEGLTYVFGGESLSWPWRELSAFAFEEERARITFIPKRGKAWRPGWFQMKTRPGQAGAIFDCYDAPLQDIAAKLNELRANALRGGDTA